MRIVQGYQLRVHEISHLSKQEYEHLRAKVGIFAVSIEKIFDDPILVKGDCIITYYTREEYARETVKHIQAYLKSLKMIDSVTVTLENMELSLGWDDVDEVANARNARKARNAKKAREAEQEEQAEQSRQSRQM